MVILITTAIALLFIIFMFNYKIKSKIILFTKRHLANSLIGLLAVSLTVSIVNYPEIAFDAAYEGLDVWFNIVFPALLPFFIGAQLLMGLGVVHFMGVLLEPFMRPLFNVPGEGSFVLAMGLASGYPIGAMLTGKLRRQNLLTQVEAERLMSFCNTADPLFMFGAVAVGMFHSTSLGPTIALAHYISVILVGLLLRFYKMNSKITFKKKSEDNILIRAFREMYKARKNDGRPFGKLLGDCITESVNAMLLIGGFIILFSVIIRIINKVGIAVIFYNVIKIFLSLFGLEESLAPAVFSGLFEITLGTKLASEAASPLIQKVMIASAVIAWSGLSVHAQVASMVSGTDIKMAPYIIARVFHGFFAAVVTYFLMKGQTLVFNKIVPVVSYIQKDTGVEWLSILSFNTKLFLVIIALVVVLCLGIGCFNLLKSISKKFLL